MSENNKKKFRILVIDDEEHVRDLLREMLELSGYDCEVAESGRAGLRRLRGRDPYHLLVTDIRLPDISGLEVLDIVGKRHPFLPVIVVTGYATIENTKEALRRGALDYIPKPFTTETVISSVERALGSSRVKGGSAPQIVYRSRLMEQVMDLVQKVARTDSSVLVTGESGTGKELIARSIHRNSRRSSQQFVSVNSGALPEGLLESELFGHVKGAFTGAVQTTLGRFQVADGGTLFLDEIGNMSLAMQVKLLRVLQDGEFTPVGSTEVLTTDTRVIAATNASLESAMAEGSFREDLYYRLNVIEIHVPPLRQRTEDILPLAEFFLERLVPGPDPLELSAEAASTLLSHRWPGNVRELENTMERAAVLCDGQTIRMGDLPPRMTLQGLPGGEELPEEGDVDLDGVLSNIERHYIERALEDSGWNRTEAARRLGLKRTTLLARMNRLGIAAPGV